MISILYSMPTHLKYRYTCGLQQVSIYGGTGTLTHYKQIEDVQIIIFCFISYKCSLFKQLNSGYVYNIIQLFNLQTLNYRRKYSYSKFLVKLLNKDIDDSFIILVLCLKYGQDLYAINNCNILCKNNFLNILPIVWKLHFSSSSHINRDGLEQYCLCGEDQL